jgi:hypothetical protein
MNLRALIIFGTSLVFLFPAMLLHCRPGSPINRENFEKIKLGMTKKEVEEIFGPAGDHSSGPLAAFVSPDEIWEEWKDRPEDFAQGILDSRRKSLLLGWYWREGVSEWASDAGIIQLVWDWNGKIEYKGFFDARPRLVSPLDRIRRWFLREERQVVSIPPRPVRISGGIGP